MEEVKDNTMDIFKKTRELGEMIRASQQMEKVNELEAKQQEDKDAAEGLKEFNLNRMNLAREMQKGTLSKEEAIKKNDEAFAELCQKSSVIKDYVEAKKEFDNMVAQVNQILNYYITGLDPNCTHNCATCGGCADK